MSHAATVPRPYLTERIFAVVPFAPWLQGCALAFLLVAFLGLLAWGSGDLRELREMGGPVWQHRDARLAVVVSLMAAAVVTSLCYHAAGTRDDLRAVARLGGWRVEDLAPVANGGRLGDRIAMALGYLFVPSLALVVDRDPGLYFTEGYWLASKIWTWLLGGTAIGGLFVLVHRAMHDARHFSALAERLPSIDLLDTGALAPFARQALRAVVPALLGTTFIALNAGDRDFLWGVSVVGGINLLAGGLALTVPLRGVRRRVRRAKEQELARIHAAIRGEPGALLGSPIEAREAPPLGDLLAWRSHVVGVPEWPLDLSILRRYGLYLVIPMASWIGGALVERLLDTVLG